ncbi:tyrosine-type recombinase/integrase [Microbispora rosea]|uniref:tyrosine-type recombinase/integrase n=1 Tax=Microbispora rosea TaxID=58117 RepID=UPI00341A11F8
MGRLAAASGSTDLGYPAGAVEVVHRARKRFTTSRREGLHQLRHYYASVMLAGGVSVKELAEYLGHADPGFTLRVYAHMMPGSHDRARKAIDDRLFRPRAVSGDQGATG